MDGEDAHTAKPFITAASDLPLSGRYSQRLMPGQGIFFGRGKVGQATDKALVACRL